MFRLLSYPLSLHSPVWPGNPPAAVVEPFAAISAGAGSNTNILHLFSHSGTHLDAPKHFNDEAACAVDLPIERYVFHAPAVLDVAKPDGGLILQEELIPYAAKLADADLALLRTGWSEVRTMDPDRYVRHGPLLHPDGARYLMEEFPGLLGVAIDAVSIGAPGYPAETTETHRILTGVGRTDGCFLLILEDLRIDADLDQARRVYAWPLLIEGSDGSPCTIVAEFAD